MRVWVWGAGQSGCLSELIMSPGVGTRQAGKEDPREDGAQPLCAGSGALGGAPALHVKVKAAINHPNKTFL